jgi:hypothetical protein
VQRKFRHCGATLQNQNCPLCMLVHSAKPATLCTHHSKHSATTCHSDIALHVYSSFPPVLL